jgi:hypothetical protein
VDCHTFSVLLQIPWITVPRLTKHNGWIYVQFKVQLDVPFTCILYSTFFSCLYMFQVLFAPILRSTTAVYSTKMTMLKVWGCPNQYLLQWNNIPNHTHTYGCTLQLCSWGRVQIAPQTCTAKRKTLNTEYT